MLVKMLREVRGGRVRASLLPLMILLIELVVSSGTTSSPNRSLAPGEAAF